VVFQHYVISNLDHYFPQPEQFLPERWLKVCHEDKRTQNHHPFASLPFGYGRRMCLGRRFADLEIQMVIAKVGHHIILQHQLKPLTSEYELF
jgi:cytochrome P450 family 49 subfamily A